MVPPGGDARTRTLPQQQDWLSNQNATHSLPLGCQTAPIGTTEIAEGRRLYTNPNKIEWGVGLLRITTNQSAKAAKNYYTHGLKHGDSIAGGTESKGTWGGRAADRLGLTGEVEQAHFFALTENRNPTTLEPLTAATRSNRRVGYDFTFNAPKSASLTHAITKDDRILEAFERSVHATMGLVERDMQTRVRRDGANEDRPTGNLAYAAFTHRTARPHEGVVDPHLHAHAFTFNATHDPVEDRWKAGQFGHIKTDARYYEAAFHANLARDLYRLGYDLRRNLKCWELHGIPRRTVRKFSRRTSHIETRAEQLGLAYPEDKAALGAKTREPKHPTHGQEELQRAWMDRLTAAERQAFTRLRDAATSRPLPEYEFDHEDAVNFAIDHSFERRSVLSDKELLEVALRRGLPFVTPDRLEEELDKRTDLIRVQRDSRELLTTPEVLAEENTMIRFVRAGRGRLEPLAATARVGRDFLNEQQRAAVRHVWRSRDRVTAIRGGAGVGKTTLMMEAVEGIQAGGTEVFTFAPSAEASRGVLRSEGFEDADTIQSLLISPERQARVRGGVIWIDEAGLIGARTMNAVFKVAQEQDARVVLSGDTRQHRSVERGDAFRILQRHAGLATAEVSEIQRQQGRYKEAVEHLSRGDVQAGYRVLDEIGAIQQVESRDERHQKLVEGYLGANNARQSAIIVSPTHREGNAVTDRLRDALKKEGRLGGEEREYVSYRNLNLTQAEKRDPLSYQRGMVLEFTHRDGPHKRGERLSVVGWNDENTLSVKAHNSEGTTLDLEKRGKFEVYQLHRIHLAEGDRVRITRNGYAIGNDDKTHRLNNGALYTVKSTTPEGDVMLENGWVVPGGYAHLTHGYATTSHASQGKTVDRVFIAQSAESARAASQEQFYVSVSRGRRAVTVFTDDKQQLLGAVRQSGERLSAHELAPDKGKPLSRGRPNQWGDLLSAYQRPGKSQAEPERDRVREDDGEIEPDWD